MTTFNPLLKSVSRSFYLSLRVLPEKIRPVMGVGYLFCRAADSIADTDLVPIDERRERLLNFGELLNTFPIDKKRLDAFMAKIKETITTTSSNESLLLQHLPEVAEWFNACPRTDQALIAQITLSVINGMDIDLKSFGASAETLRALSTMQELEDYIALIGGEPGRFWTNVLLAYGLTHNPSREKFIEDGISFGKGLQMINILKDLPKDLQRGRCYLPLEKLNEVGLTPENLLRGEKIEIFLTLYHQLIDQTLDRLRHGLTYVSQLGSFDWRLRASVWWPLLIGLKTLRHLRHSTEILNPASANKVGRKEIYKLMAGSLFTLPSNKILTWEFERLAEEASSGL